MVDIAAAHQVLHGRDQLAVVLVPARGPDVQCVAQIGVRGLQPDTEKVAEQLVIAVRTAFCVQRDDEQAGRFRGAQQYSGVGATGQVLLPARR